jgi:hypothetical protein
MALLIDGYNLVHFARRHSDADEMIEDLLEQCAAPKSLLVVSSDHRVQRAARHRGASFIDSEQWYEAQLALARETRGSDGDPAAKPTGAMTAEEINYWLGEFDQPADVQEDSSDVFPPGYGDDLGDDV